MKCELGKLGVFLIRTQFKKSGNYKTNGKLVVRCRLEFGVPLPSPIYNTFPLTLNSLGKPLSLSTIMLL